MVSKIRFKKQSYFLFCLLFSITTIEAQIQLPQMVRDSMVLQRDADLRLWGWASEGEQVRLHFKGKDYETMAIKGEWSFKIPPTPAGGPYEMVFKGKNNIVLSNILFGDVWLCSGQSNMVHQMNIHDVTYAKDIATANYPEIRQFLVPNNTNLQGPEKDYDKGSWQAAVKENVRPFSAVAFFFAKKLYDKYKVPIGLLNASVGGTPIEAWTSEEGLVGFPEIVKTITTNKDVEHVEKQLSIPQAKRLVYEYDAHTSPEEEPWYSPGYDTKDWRTMNIPGYWEDQGIKNLDGVVWYSKDIMLSETFLTAPAKVFLGRIVDADVMYINGVEVGKTTYQYPQRRYAIPDNVLKIGKNTFVIKVTNFNGKGGFVPDKPYALITENDTLDLKGYWRYKVGKVFRPQPKQPVRFNPQNQPTALFNAMIAPLKNYSIKGILWYQGESNAGNPNEYDKLFPALIADWRNKFGNPDLPFIYAQLPNFMDVDYLPSSSNWARLREAQLKALSLPNTAMTVNIDLGEWNDIHPDNKKDVGQRMALAAQSLAYGDDVVYSGPIYKSNRIEGNKIIVSFYHTGSGLMTFDGKPLAEFAIAGSDKEFVWATAIIKNNEVVVFSEEVAEPKYVRYAWADNPNNPNLYNKEGLPASPFRTDTD